MDSTPETNGTLKELITEYEERHLPQYLGAIWVNPDTGEAHVCYGKIDGKPLWRLIDKNTQTNILFDL